MRNLEIYKTWRDKLLTDVGQQFCNPCTDERRNQHTLNIENPLLCGCCCELVKEILQNARRIDDEIQHFSKS